MQPLSDIIRERRLRAMGQAVAIMAPIRLALFLSVYGEAFFVFTKR